MKTFESVVNDSLLAHFHNPQGKTLINHAANACGIEESLAIAAVFWPKLVEVEGCVFVAEFYTQSFDDLMKEFQGDKTRIERWVNAWSLADFFLLASSPSVHDDVLIEAFGETLRFFWTLRLQTLFPGEDFVVELADEIEGESGLAITFYKKR